MFDASAKLPSGILNGNVNQFGDFDQCLRVQEPSQTKRGIRSNDEGIRGKYCLAYLQPTLPDDNKYGSLQYFYDRVQSWGAFRSTFDDVSIIIRRQVSNNLLADRIRGLSLFVLSTRYSTTRKKTVSASIQ